MRFRRTGSLSPEEVLAAMRRGELRLVDVRERYEVARRGVTGAANIPLRELEGHLPELARGARVAFLCQSGMRSARAAKLAGRAGVDAANVRGGIVAWVRAGVPL